MVSLRLVEHMSLLLLKQYHSSVEVIALSLRSVLFAWLTLQSLPLEVEQMLMKVLFYVK